MVDLVVDEVDVDVHQFFGYFGGVVVGDELGDDLEGGDLDDLVAVLGEVEQQLGQVVLLGIGEQHQLRQDLHAGLPHAPDALPALLAEEHLDDLLVQEVLPHAPRQHAAAVDDLLLDAHARLLVHPHVAHPEEGFGLLLVHVGGQLGDQLDRDDLVLLVVALLELQSEGQHLLALLGGDAVADFGEQGAAGLLDLARMGRTSRKGPVTSLVRGAMNSRWQSGMGCCLRKSLARKSMSSSCSSSESPAYVSGVLRVRAGSGSTRHVRW